MLKHIIDSLFKRHFRVQVKARSSHHWQKRWRNYSKSEQ